MPYRLDYPQIVGYRRDSIVTAAQLNTHLRDNTGYLHGDAGTVTFAATLNAPLLLDASTGPSRRVEQHPYANNRHIESGTWSIGSMLTGTTQNSTINYTTAYAVAPAITLGCRADGDNGTNSNATTIPLQAWLYTVNTTGFIVYVRNTSNGTITSYLMWLAEGQD